MTKLIVSLDKLNPQEVKNIIETISKNIPEHKTEILYKFNDMIALLGFQWIYELIQGYDIRIMLDPKWNDIPNTITNYMYQLKVSWLADMVDIITIHANAGIETLKAASQAKQDQSLNLEILAITALTSQDEHDTQILYDETPKYAVLKLTKMALAAGIDGVVCSGQETQLLREVYGEDFKILNPGVRFAWWEAHEQKRVVTPQRAVENGVDYIVMGRPILDAPNIIQAVRRFFDETKAVRFQWKPWKYEFEKILYTGNWKEILSYIWAFYFRPEGGKYVRFTSKVISNAYINIAAIERNYRVIERACFELAEQIRAKNIEADIVVWAQMGSVRISLVLAEKLGIEQSVYTEKTEGNNNTMAFKRHDIELKWKKVILSEDIVSRGTTIEKMRNIIHEAGWEVVAIACVWNRYEQDFQAGIPIISCFIPPKFELYWDENTPEDQRKNFPHIPKGAEIVEKPKNDWISLVASMRR